MTRLLALEAVRQKNLRALGITSKAELEKHSLLLPADREQCASYLGQPVVTPPPLKLKPKRVRYIVRKADKKRCKAMLRRKRGVKR